MRLINCFIKGFGRLENVKYEFNPGLNPMLVGNGRGKSTLAAFLFAMLYGIPDTKKSNLDDNYRKKYTPWSGAAFGGSLTLESRGKIYRIERDFGRKASEDSFKLLDAESGRPSGDFGERLGEELFGIDADGFYRTVFLSERILSEKNENRTVSAKLSGLSGVEADLGEVDTATEILEERRKYYFKKGGLGLISDLQKRVAETENEIEALKAKEASIAKKERELLGLVTELSRQKREYGDLDGRLAEARANESLTAYKERYLALEASVRRDSLRLAELKEFFSDGEPTYEELDMIGATVAELSMKKDLPRADRDDELSMLRKYFEGKTSREEIDRLSENNKRGGVGKAVALVLMLLGVSGVIAAAISGIFALLALGALGVTGLAMLPFSCKKSSRSRDLDAFLSRFPFTDGLSREDALSEIKRQYARYEALLLLSQGREHESSAASIKEMKIREFFDRFHTVSGDPLGEIRRALTELRALTESLSRQEKELAELGAYKSDSTGAVPSAMEINEKRTRLSATISALEGEAALKKRQLDLDLADTERLDALLTRRSELNNRIEKYTENLSIIRKTQKYLKEAGERLTSRYIGKTREGFERYIRLIGRFERESVLDTDMTLMHYEGAQSHSTECYSKGTRELFAFAVRLALTDALFPDESPFIILDDPFSSFDDEALERAKNTVKVLAEERQIIYFTCSAARAL